MPRGGEGRQGPGYALPQGGMAGLTSEDAGVWEEGRRAGCLATTKVLFIASTWLFLNARFKGGEGENNRASRRDGPELQKFFARVGRVSFFKASQASNSVRSAPLVGFR